MSLQAFYGKGSHQLFLASSRDARGKTTKTDVPNRLNYCINVILYTLLTNVQAVHVIEPGWPRVGDPWSAAVNRNRLSLG